MKREHVLFLGLFGGAFFAGLLYHLSNRSFPPLSSSPSTAAQRAVNSGWPEPNNSPTLPATPKFQAPYSGSSNPIPAGWTLHEVTTLYDTFCVIVEEGMLLKTATGNYYEVAEFTFQFSRTFNPKVVVLQQGETFRLTVDGLSTPLVCRQLTSVVESEILEFDGLEFGKIFNLSNGESWQQTDASISVGVGLRRQVTIYAKGAAWKMKVEGTGRSVSVRRLR